MIVLGLLFLTGLASAYKMAEKSTESRQLTSLLLRVPTEEQPD